ARGRIGGAAARGGRGGERDWRRDRAGIGRDRSHLPAGRPRAQRGAGRRASRGDPTRRGGRGRPLRRRERRGGGRAAPLSAGQCGARAGQGGRRSGGGGRMITALRELDEERLEDIVLGAGVLGAGGGGNPYYGRLRLLPYLRAGRCRPVLSPDEVPDDALVTS